MIESEPRRIWIPGAVIIGAGPSGLAAAVCLGKRGVPSLILEKYSCIASLWKLKTYDRLRLHLPKKFCELPYMPFPPETQEYPTKEEFVNYLETYVEHFSIKPMFKREVRYASYDTSMGIWRVQAGESEYMCRWLIIATGENGEPVIPQIAGMADFEGSILHTSTYKNGTYFRGTEVLVVGCGNSGMEVSLDLSDSGANVSLVVRNKLHILPRQILGKSTFALSTWLLKWFPVKMVDLFLLFCSRLILGNTSHTGIQRPDVGPLQLKNETGKTPVLDVGAIKKIKSGRIKVVPGIKRFTSKGVDFVGGGANEYASVILATGYRSTVPSWLMDESFFTKKDGYPKNPFPNNWKGKNGVYTVGFTQRGLLGASIDAKKVSEDIAKQWQMETTQLRVKE